MNDAPYKLGDRVLATLGYTGWPRPGVVSSIVRLPTGTHCYMVRFDDKAGLCGPCEIAGYAPA